MFARDLNPSEKNIEFPLTQNDFRSGVGCSGYITFHVWQVCGACLEAV
jgi:hypothetical protein